MTRITDRLHRAYVAEDFPLYSGDMSALATAVVPNLDVADVTGPLNARDALEREHEE